MKKINVILLLAVYGWNAAGQNIREHVVLLTDRSLYITGENILFSAFLSPSAGSSILYCEIITQKGHAVAGSKFNIVDSVSSGSLSVPSGLVTGIYFFRAYTKLMRNEGPSSFSYLPLAVINPYLNEVLNTGTMAITDNLPGRQNNLLDFVKISPDKELAHSGDSIQVSVLNTSPQLSFTDVSVAVVPDSLPQYSQMILPGSGSENQRFEPERNGLSLSGSVSDRTDGKTVKDVMVNLSIPGKGRDFMSAKTDPDGRFSFPLRGFNGYRDLFLGTSKDSADYKIKIDNEFCTAPVILPSFNFSLTAAERRAVYRMALNVQVDSLFRIEPPSDTMPDHGLEDDYFYGTPDETIAIDNYVQMPSIEDYLNELPTLVKVRKSGGHKYLRILSDETGLTEYAPLVMIDLVALNDQDVILGISPNDLDRIEVINSFYVKGDQVYGGIVNCISRREDFAGINLSAYGDFIRYEFPINKSDEVRNPGQQLRPDARNTVIWIPHLSLDNESKISFTAPRTPGRYLITVKGVTSEGNEFISSASFDVE